MLRALTIYRLGRATASAAQAIPRPNAVARACPGLRLGSRADARKWTRNDTEAAPKRLAYLRCLIYFFAIEAVWLGQRFVMVRTEHRTDRRA